jgi:hypothetical protein
MIEGLRPFIAIPQSIREWSKWCREQALTSRVCLSSYIESPSKFTEQDIHGGIDLLSGTDTLDSSTPIVVSKMPGKFLFSINAGSVLTGSMTITGTSVDRDTGVQTGSDTEVISVSGTTTDTSDTDAEGNTRTGFVNGYIGNKWWTGSVTISTTDLTITDIDVYHISFEQFDGASSMIIDDFDISVETTNANAWLYAYLYSVEVTDSNVDITRIASLNIDSGDAVDDTFARLRRGNIGINLAGPTDGIFVALFLGPSNQTYFSDLSMKIWARLPVIQ